MGGKNPISMPFRSFLFLLFSFPLPHRLLLTGAFLVGMVDSPSHFPILLYSDSYHQFAAHFPVFCFIWEDRMGDGGNSKKPAIYTGESLGRLSVNVHKRTNL